jgi:hypothetical protein
MKMAPCNFGRNFGSIRPFPCRSLNGETAMYKLAILGAAALSFAVVSTTHSFAKSKKNSLAPGQQMHALGSKPGYPGASGYAPRQVKKMRRGHNARAFAPRYRLGR